ncbi:translation initiation factor if-2 [Metamycoplasma alkalescens]|nr:translation initiation factor if-2 [Metamycoplasma alkalescens]
MSVDGKPLQKVLPGEPCIITGLHKSPLSGDRFIVVSDEKFAKKLAEEKSFINKQKELSERNSFSIKDGKKTLNIIIKTDVQGTAEAIKQAILKIKNDEININVIRATAGELTKADLLLAETSNSRIYLFNINASAEIKKIAESKQIKIMSHNIIYKIIEEIQAIINTLKEPVYEEKQIGLAKVIKLFFYSKVGTIAGCKMLEGLAKEFCKVEVFRKNKSIFKGMISSLKIEKNDVKVVEKGFDFGTHIKDFDKIELDDELKFYEDVLV